MRSSGGSVCFGVIVSVTVSFEASMPGSEASESSACCTAFFLRHDELVKDLETIGCARGSEAKGPALRSSSRGSDIPAIVEAWV